MYQTAGFLRKHLGVRVEKLSADVTLPPEPETDKLLELGRQWMCDGEEWARDDFNEHVQSLFTDGQAERLLHCCHELVVEHPNPSSASVADLTEWVHQDRLLLLTAMN